LGEIFCEKLIYEIDEKMLEIMQNTSILEWNKPTIFKEWKVKDVVSHMVDTMIRKLSMQRDGYFDESLNIEIKCNADLIRFVTRLADEWTIATKRIIPKMLIELFDSIKDEYYSYISSLDPNSKALFSVSWAGEDTSKVWFDNARDYTEHWVHQQQIREALNVPGLLDKRYLYPFNDILIRALPVTFLSVNKQYGFSINISILGNAKENYCLLKAENGWNLYRGSSSSPNTAIKVKDTILWRIFTSNINKDKIDIDISGDKSIVEALLKTKSMLI
jgi:hypothetical protein